MIAAQGHDAQSERVEALLDLFDAAATAYELLRFRASSLRVALFDVSLMVHASANPDAEYALRLWASDKRRCVSLVEGTQEICTHKGAHTIRYLEALVGEDPLIRVQHDARPMLHLVDQEAT